MIASNDAWCRAETLGERLAALRATDPASRPPIDDARADRLLHRWQAEPAFGGDGSFVARLAAEGIGEDELRRLLGEPASALADRVDAPPAWSASIVAALQDGSTASRRPLPDDARELKMAPFLDLVAPLIDQARTELVNDLAALRHPGTDVLFDPNALEAALFAPLPRRLLAQLGRTLALELHVAGLRGLLAGETPEDRYRSFVVRIAQPEVAAELLTEYPVLARDIVETLERWRVVGLEFARHLTEDWAEIVATFPAAASAGLLADIRGEGGDGHRGGRAVLIAVFTSGIPARVQASIASGRCQFWAAAGLGAPRGAPPPFRA